jgi:hypothetical protein
MEVVVNCKNLGVRSQEKQGAGSREQGEKNIYLLPFAF